MEKYLIYFNETPTSKQYISYVYRNSLSKSSDIGDAIEFDDKDTAIKMKDYLNRRDSVSKYKVMCIKTTIEEAIE
ncbi:MAG: hypothetical protein IJL74_04810 [Bacilli bacterium]|nr:hypothetical protein [Bacilli bacterium]